MNILDVIQSVAKLFIYFWSIQMPIGQYKISVGACVVFAGIATIVIKFIRGLSE